MKDEQEPESKHPNVPEKNPDANRKTKVPGYDEKNPGQSYPEKK